MIDIKTILDGLETACASINATKDEVARSEMRAAIRELVSLPFINRWNRNAGIYKDVEKRTSPSFANMFFAEIEAYNAWAAFYELKGAVTV